jgi:hypothetical protein
MKREGRCGALLGVWCAIGLTITMVWAQTAATQFNRINLVVLNLSQFGEGRRWCPWVQGGIEEAGVCAGDQPCNGEEIRRASARFDAR